LAQVAYRALFSDRPFGDEPFAQLRTAAAAYYDGLVQMGVAQGVIGAHIDRGLAVFLFGAVFNEFGRYLLEREKVDLQDLANGKVDYQRLNVEGMASQLIEILQRGLAPRVEVGSEQHVAGKESITRL
jgi:hypothetical protein